MHKQLQARAKIREAVNSWRLGYMASLELRYSTRRIACQPRVSFSPPVYRPQADAGNDTRPKKKVGGGAVGPFTWLQVGDRGGCFVMRWHSNQLKKKSRHASGSTPGHPVSSSKGDLLTSHSIQHQTLIARRFISIESHQNSCIGLWLMLCPCV